MQLFTLVMALSAHASVPDMYGSGVRSMGMGGGGVALVDDGNAARLNPAGLGYVRQPTAGIGLSTAIHNFRELPEVAWDTNRDGVVDDRDTPLDVSPQIDDAAGIHLFVGRNVGGKFGVGLNAYVPTQRLIRFSTFEPTIPTYVMYENRPQRFSLDFGFGGKIIKGISVGASAEILAQAHLNLLLSIDAGVSGQAGTSDELISELRITTHQLTVDVRPAVVPILGLQLDFGEWVPAVDGLQLGVVYRGGGGIPITANLDIQANISLEDIGDLEPYIMAIVLKGNLNLIDHYTPPYLNFGLAWHNDGIFSIYADFKYTFWDAFELNIAHLDTENTQVTSPLINVDGNIVDGTAHPAPVWQNTVSVQAGAELRVPRIQVKSKVKYIDIAFRGGFGYFPTPLVSQSGETAFLDSDRNMYTVGIGLEHWDPLKLVDAPVRYDLFFQYNSLASGILPRDSNDSLQPGFPIDTTVLPIGGSIIHFGGAWSFDY